MAPPPEPRLRVLQVNSAPNAIVHELERHEAVESVAVGRFPPSVEEITESGINVVMIAIPPAEDSKTWLKPLVETVRAVRAASVETGVIRSPHALQQLARNEDDESAKLLKFLRDKAWIGWVDKPGRGLRGQVDDFVAAVLSNVSGLERKTSDVVERTSSAREKSSERRDTALAEERLSSVEERSAYGATQESFAVHRLSLSPERLVLAPGAAATITATPVDADDTHLTGVTVEWRSTDPDAVTVDERGVVTAVAPGGAEVVAAAGKATASAKVVVIEEEKEEREEAAPSRPPGRLLEVGGVPIAPAGVAALLSATALAELAERDEVDATLVFAGIALAGDHTEGRQDTAFFLTRTLTSKDDASPADVASALDLAASRGIDPSALPVPLASRVAESRAVDAAVAAAGEVVRRVGAGSDSDSRRHRPPVSTRHLLAALLVAPVGEPVRRRLRDLGHDVDHLREDFLDFLLSRPVTEDHAAWQEVLLPGGFVPVGRLREAPAATVFADVLTGEDLLDVEPEVNALAAVIASGRTTPPLSVGLFGDWGTGKSFFMRKLQDRVAWLEAEAEAGRADGTCGRIAQIWFNAWHYLDANLWASLATHIFDSLADQLATTARRSPAEMRAEISRRLDVERSALADAEHRKQLAESARDAAQRRLDAIGESERSIGERLRSSAQAIGAATRDEPVVRRKVREAENALHLDEGSFDADDLHRHLSELQGLGGRLRAIAHALAHRDRRWRSFAWIAALALLPLLAALLIDWLTGFDDVVQAAGAAMAAIGTLATWLKPWYGRAGEALRRLEAANADAQRLEDERRRREETLRAEQKVELDRLAAEARAARAEHETAEREVERLEREIREIAAGRRMGRFIEERSGSDDYRRHLGVVHLIRSDFDRLEALLREVVESVAGDPADADGGGPTSIERIVLYIDDLDRCPPGRVMEVLQAVHLLLAFELFIVVVGVDARWLLRSVEVHHDRALSSGDGDRDRPGRTGYRPTPRHYLEKIFQIPLALRPMDERGFGRMVDELLDAERDERGTGDGAAEDGTRGGRRRAQAGSGDRTEPEETPSAGLVSEEEEATGGTERDGARSPSEESTAAPTFASASGPRETGAGLSRGADEPDDAPEKTAEVLPDGLVVGDGEQAFLRLLWPLVRSPRAAKRFVNVYRFLRVQLGPRELARFRDGVVGTREEGDAGEPPEHRAAALLLAVLTGMPGPAERVLDALAAPEARTHADVRALVRDAAPGDGTAEEEKKRFEEMEVALDAVWEAAERRGMPLPAAAGPYARWAGEVARFSFRRSAAAPARPVS